MKFYVIFFVFPMIMAAQQPNPCVKTATLYSRELFRGPVTVERAMALSGLESACVENASEKDLSLPESVNGYTKPPYQYSQIDTVRQDANGRDLFLGVITDVLVKYLVYDRRQ